MNFKLPPWAYWEPEEWKGKYDTCSEIVENMLGWDLTDFGSGDFHKRGLILFAIRNGNQKLDNKIYAEKIMIVEENQETPMHFHWSKMEDIINRGGGPLVIEVSLSDPETERERVKVHRYSHGVESSDRLDRDALFFPPAYRTVVKHYHPLLTAFLDEGVSLIYYPVMAGMGIDSVTLSDGLTNRPIGHAEPEEWEGLERRAVTKPAPPIEALPLLCPNCGWDLECEEKSRVALCPGCTLNLAHIFR